MGGEIHLLFMIGYLFLSSMFDGELCNVEGVKTKRLALAQGVARRICEGECFWTRRRGVLRTPVEDLAFW